MAGGQGCSWSSLRKGRRRKAEHAVWEQSQEPGRKALGRKFMSSHPESLNFTGFWLELLPATYWIAGGGRVRV